MHLQKTIFTVMITFAAIHFQRDGAFAENHFQRDDWVGRALWMKAALWIKLGIISSSSSISNTIRMLRPVRNTVLGSSFSSTRVSSFSSSNSSNIFNNRTLPTTKGSSNRYISNNLSSISRDSSSTVSSRMRKLCRQLQLQ